MNNKHWKLIQAVLKASISEDWDSALQEWSVIGHDYTYGDGECACGKQHISELNYVKNRFTGIELIIGSECINKFFDVNVKSIHSSLKRVLEDDTKSLSMDLICKAYEENIISRWQYAFYCDINKKKLIR